MMQWTEVFEHDECTREEMYAILKPDYGHFIASITPIVWGDGTKQFRVVEEPSGMGRNMRHIYCVDIPDTAQK